MTSENEIFYQTSQLSDMDSRPIIDINRLADPIIIKTIEGTGVLNISTVQGGGDVYLDGEIYGVAPITVTNIEPGLHNYTVKLEGYLDYVKQVEVVVGQICCEKVDMSYNGSTGTCTTRPPDVVAPSPSIVTPSPSIVTPPETVVAPVVLTPLQIVAYAIVGTIAAMIIYNMFFGKGKKE